MIHVGNHRHVPDVGLFVHDGPDLIHSEVHLWGVGCMSHVAIIYAQPAAEVHFIHRMFLFMSRSHSVHSRSRQSYKKKDMSETEPRRKEVVVVEGGCGFCLMAEATNQELLSHYPHAAAEWVELDLFLEFICSKAYYCFKMFTRRSIQAVTEAKKTIKWHLKISYSKNRLFLLLSLH